MENNKQGRQYKTEENNKIKNSDDVRHIRGTHSVERGAYNLNVLRYVFYALCVMRCGLHQSLLSLFREIIAQMFESIFGSHAPLGRASQKPNLD